ncbi:hypothetical protein AGMMS50239_05570 [Bacteroidia bacterium]|nr:hypothetical protein AGMMS50239_05570 [Bacteroidia bacterium]
MSYTEKIKTELSEYKEQKYPHLANGEYTYKGKTDYYHHILPKICGELNLIETFRNDFLESDLSKIKFHQYFHHLNSSQAMCINFFFPLFIKQKLDIILKKFKLDNEVVNYVSVKFEKESNIDDKKQIREKIPELKQNQTIPTSFDFYFETQSGIKFYFEIKYTENEFGCAKKDKNSKDYENKYKLKYERIYEEAAKGKIISNDETSFLSQYQIMRNLIHVDDNSYVVFVIPEKNERVYSQATTANKFVVEGYEKHVKVLTWDSLYKLIDNQNFDCNLKKHFDEFKQKYKL